MNTRLQMVALGVVAGTRDSRRLLQKSTRRDLQVSLASLASPISSFGREPTKVDATSVFEGRLSSTYTVNDAGVLQFYAPSLNRALVARGTLSFAGRSPVLRLNDKLQIILCELRKPLSNQETDI
jgi:hypothetical protein